MQKHDTLELYKIFEWISPTFPKNSCNFAKNAHLSIYEGVQWQWSKDRIFLKGQCPMILKGQCPMILKGQCPMILKGQCPMILKEQCPMILKGQCPMISPPHFFSQWCNSAGPLTDMLKYLEHGFNFWRN